MVIPCQEVEVGEYMRFRVAVFPFSVMDLNRKWLPDVR